MNTFSLKLVKLLKDSAWTGKNIILIEKKGVFAIENTLLGDCPREQLDCLVTYGIVSSIVHRSRVQF